MKCFVLSLFNWRLLDYSSANIVCICRTFCLFDCLYTRVRLIIGGKKLASIFHVSRERKRGRFVWPHFDIVLNKQNETRSEVIFDFAPFVLRRLREHN